MADGDPASWTLRRAERDVAPEPPELAMARALAEKLDGGSASPASMRIARALALSLVDQLETMIADLDAAAACARS
jgi:hypothetical protein